MLQVQADPSMKQPELHNQHFPKQIAVHLQILTREEASLTSPRYIQITSLQNMQLMAELS
jgi:hypothetical protein